MTIAACNPAADVIVLLLPQDTPGYLDMSLKRKLNIAVDCAVEFL